MPLSIRNLKFQGWQFFRIKVIEFATVPAAVGKLKHFVVDCFAISFNLFIFCVDEEKPPREKVILFEANLLNSLKGFNLSFFILKCVRVSIETSFHALQ